VALYTNMMHEIELKSKRIVCFSTVIL